MRHSLLRQLCARTLKTLSVKNRLDEVKFRCFPVKRTLRRQECSPRRSGGERTVYLSCSTKRFPPSCCFASRRQRSKDRKSTRLNSSHGYISYAVFCLKKKKTATQRHLTPR